MDDSGDLTGPWPALAAVRFLAELGLLAALGYVGWELAGENAGVGVVLAVVLAALAAAAWGAWVAPRAARRLDDPARLAVEVALFGTAVTGLAVTGAWVAAAVLGLAYVVSAPVGRKGH
jgi:hypothetical protein